MHDLVLALAIPLVLVSPVQARASREAGPDDFAQGRFEAADSAFQKVLNGEPGNVEALLGLGRLRLLENRLPEAERLFEAVLDRDPDDELANKSLGEAFYRQDRFDLAAPAFRAAGDVARAKHMEAFADLQPYTFEAAPERSEVRFEVTEPLPVVRLKVNGREAEFVIDTGGDELHLDSVFAAEIGATLHAEKARSFAGGRTLVEPFGKVDRVEIGEYRIRHLPVTVLPLGPIAQAFGRPLKGVVGTTFLSHFLFTLDYPAGKLVLQRRTPARSEALAVETRAQNGHELPLWLASDHMMVSRGRVNASPEVMLYLDTGMAGAGGIMVSETLAKEAGIEPPAAGVQGIGGGGAVTIRPIVVKEVRLGPVLERDVRGVYGGLHTSDEYRAACGFRVAGIVSHSFFRPYRVSFDLLGMHVHLVKPSAHDPKGE